MSDTPAMWAAVAVPFIIAGAGWMLAVERRLGALQRVEKQLDRLVRHFIPDANED
jgi:hypothetical protein